MTKLNVFSNGIFWGISEACTPKEAMQEAADDNGETRARTEGMTAEKSE